MEPLKYNSQMIERYRANQEYLETPFSEQSQSILIRTADFATFLQTLMDPFDATGRRADIANLLCDAGARCAPKHPIKLPADFDPQKGSIEAEIATHRQELQEILCRLLIDQFEDFRCAGILAIQYLEVSFLQKYLPQLVVPWLSQDDQIYPKLNVVAGFRVNTRLELHLDNSRKVHPPVIAALQEPQKMRYLDWIAIGLGSYTLYRFIERIGLHAQTGDDNMNHDQRRHDIDRSTISRIYGENGERRLQLIYLAEPSR